MQHEEGVGVWIQIDPTKKWPAYIFAFAAYNSKLVNHGALKLGNQRRYVLSVAYMSCKILMPLCFPKYCPLAASWNVSGIQIFRAQFLALHLRKVMLNAANIYLFGIIHTKCKYIYRSFLALPEVLVDCFETQNPLLSHLCMYSFISISITPRTQTHIINPHLSEWSDVKYFIGLFTSEGLWI